MSILWPFLGAKDMPVNFIITRTKAQEEAWKELGFPPLSQEPIAEITEEPKAEVKEEKKRGRPKKA